jgi:predicted naringenin-chalcone synthase
MVGECRNDQRLRRAARSPRACQRQLRPRLPRSATATAWEVFRDYGNMSPPTVLFIIDKLRQARAPRPCVAIGFGPGLTAEVALWQ